MCIIHSLAKNFRKYIVWHFPWTYSEECASGSTAVGAILDLGLFGKIFCRVHRGRHLWSRQEGCNKSSLSLLSSSLLSLSSLSPSSYLPSLLCRRRSWWGWRTTTCLPPSGWKLPWSSWLWLGIIIYDDDNENYHDYDPHDHDKTVRMADELHWKYDNR